MAKQIDNPQTLILNVSKQILINSGYNSLNMRSVAKECGISIGSIYNYYPNKSELIVAMMAEYWDDFFHYFDELEKLSFFSCLRTMFFRLDEFVSVFKEVWLKPELYKSKDSSIEKGVKKEREYLIKIQLFIEKQLVKEFSLEDNLNKSELSNFIISNFMSMLQNKRYSYDSFEKILKKLLL